MLSVITFHAFPRSLRGGFIGVDVFFVISGYLICTILFENLDRGTFSFAEFYARRIKRIFPALLLLIACYTFGWYALLADEYAQLGKHIAAGAGFVSNIALWGEAGYFDNAVETKPLLHLWSLGIEEQFYIAWPLLLWLAWRQKFSLLRVTALVALVSFGLNLYQTAADPVAAFFSPQTRVWELLFGSLLAWAALYRKDALAAPGEALDRWLAARTRRASTGGDGAALPNLLSWSGLALLGFGFVSIRGNTSFPGASAVVPVLGAGLLITAGAAGLGEPHDPVTSGGGLDRPDQFPALPLALAVAVVRENRRKAGPRARASAAPRCSSPSCSRGSPTDSSNAPFGSGRGAGKGHGALRRHDRRRAGRL